MLANTELKVSTYLISPPECVDMTGLGLLKLRYWDYAIRPSASAQIAFQPGYLAA